ncbi:MAG TPA: GNAT family N-acetyltransferase [Actinomycetota bacterium]|nr:GNAT family N-acetyltransferase [Actinomycetota bacterium]
MALRLSLSDSWSPDVIRPWERVLEQDRDAGVFSTPSWLQAWWETLGSGELLLATVWDDGDPIAVFPGCRCVSESGLLTFLGGEDVTDQQVPVAVPGREAHALSFFLDWAFTEGGFRRLRFHSVPSTERWRDVVGSVADEKGLAHASEQVDVSPEIVLPATFDEYLASLSGHDRHELRRKRRRLDEAGKVTVRRAHEVGWEDDLAAFFEFHRQAPGEKAAFFTEERERFFRRLAADLFLFGMARLDVLDLDGEPVACTFSYDFRGSLELYNSSFRPDLAKLAPGMVLIGHLIEQAIAEGKARFDFLRGDERYKMRFGPVPRPVYQVMLAVPATSGQHEGRI